MACNSNDPLPAARGQVFRTTLLAVYTPQQVDSAKAALGIVELGAVTSNYGVRIYEIVYNTIDPQGAPTLAAGALVVPEGTNAPVPLASYQHGTITRKSSAPSSLGFESNIGLMLASNQGFAVCMPDYLGLSIAPETYQGMHPYIHARSQASAAIDMVRATRNFVRELSSVQLNHQLFLFGYSQGGHATMATLRDMERLFPDEFVVTACYPMAGPYDLSVSQAEILASEDPYNAGYYLPYVMLGLNDVYRIYDSPSDFLKSPYDVQLPPLFDGYNSEGHINSFVPDVPNEMVIDAVLEDFRTNPNHPFRQVLRDNDLYQFHPRAPMRLCHCSGDELVTESNTNIAHQSFIRQGRTDISWLNPGELAHGDCAIPCLVDGLGWFSSLKE